MKLKNIIFYSLITCYATVIYTEQVKAQTNIQPLYVTERTLHDTDDPAIWINKESPSESLIIGTDKDEDGALYVFNMKGEIIEDKVVRNLKRPNNVDVAYGMALQGNKVDIAVTTERYTSKLRVFSVPEMKPIDDGGINVFEGEHTTDYRSPMGISLYKTLSGDKLYAIVSRKSGPTNGTYLWQYLLEDDGEGNVTGTLVRKFGKHSGEQEIEAVAVDRELGYVYYSDEKAGIRKYYADPAKGNAELALFGTSGFRADQEGISIYKIEDGTGYILVSDQAADKFHIFPREGSAGNPHDHPLIKTVPVETESSDGSEVVNYPILPDFPNGLFVAMSSDRTFHLYRWEDIAGQDLRIEPPTITLHNAPVLQSPANGATGTPVSPSLNWNAAEGADTYQVQVSAASDFQTTVFAQSGIMATSTQVSNLNYNTLYYWRVRAINSAGSSAWSSAWSFTTTTFAPLPPTGMLVGHWKMDEGSGSTLFDASGYSNNATTEANPARVDGVYGQALELDRSSQYAAVPDHSSLDITDAITLAAWVKPAELGTQYILKKAIINETDGYELSLASNGKVFFRVNEATYKNTYRLNSSAPYPKDGDTWTHIAATYDGSVIKIYIDGIENASKKLHSPVAISTNRLPLAIGAGSNGDRNLEGAIDDARVYNIALGASEIAELATRSALSAVATQEVKLEKGTDDNYLQAYPNPFSSRATIRFTIPKSDRYSITLHDSKGAKVMNLLQRRNAVAGVQNILVLDGSDLANGLYILRLQTSDGAKTLKLFLNK